MARHVVADKDLGFKKLMKEIEYLSNYSVVAGVQDGEVTKSASRNKHKKKAGESMAQIAGDNEFGTNIIPARSFLRSSFDENLAVLENYSESRFDSVFNGQLTSKKALGQIGVVLQGVIQRKINQIRTPPNSPRTIREKGSTKPLIDFGQLVQSIKYALRKNTQ